MSVRKPRRRRITDFSNPDFEPEKRSAWKRAKRSDLPRNASTRHQVKKAAEKAAKRAAKESA